MQLKEFLRQKGWSETLFAKIAGVPQPVIHRVANGKSGVTLRNAAKIVKATRGKVTFWDLLASESQNK